MAKAHHLSIETQGSGDTLVFLHGFCESKEVWTNFVRPLQQKFNTITLDLPGFGNNTAERSDYSMESMADYVKDALEELDVRKCILVGHSMGGYVSMAFAEKYGNLLRGLCLFQSSALPDSQEKKENREKTIDFVERNGVEKFIQSFVEPLFYSGNRERLQQEIEMMKQLGKATPQQSVSGGLAAMRDRPDRTHILKDANFPLLFIFGKDDPAVPLEAALQQCHLPGNSMAYFLAETGHMAMFERAYETRKALEKFAETIFG
ncbi:alpha/beta fold hydrolase [Pontibacter ruber]|uniref:Alpha/beta fold hydrolase n=1 Tax=Pontibacter ruber TaxID=1343895 RepID=A0ABW5CV18_9BACT|nr:alpha/beta hydrolase [Pontibacter ruber]